MLRNNTIVHNIYNYYTLILQLSINDSQFTNEMNKYKIKYITRNVVAVGLRPAFWGYDKITKTKGRVCVRSEESGT